MGWFQSLFGAGSKGTAKATVVNVGGAYLIDVRPLADNPRGWTDALAAITAQVEAKPQPVHVWIASEKLFDALDRKFDTMDILDSLMAATRKLSPMMIIEGEPTEAIVFLLRSSGFEVYEPGFKLQLRDGQTQKLSELDVLDHLEKIRRAPTVTT